MGNQGGNAGNRGENAENVGNGVGMWGIRMEFRGIGWGCGKSGWEWGE